MPIAFVTLSDMLSVSPDHLGSLKRRVRDVSRLGAWLRHEYATRADQAENSTRPRVRL